MEDLKNKVDAVAEEVKDSFKEGAKSFIDDIAADKHIFDELSDERKVGKEAKRADKKDKLEDAIDAVLDSFKQGVEEFKSDASFTKDTFDELHAEHKAEKAAKEAAKRAKFDDNVESLKDKIDS